MPLPVRQLKSFLSYYCRGDQRRGSSQLSGAEDNRQRKVAEPPTTDERARRPRRRGLHRLRPLARRRELRGSEEDALDEGGRGGGDEEEVRLRVLKNTAQAFESMSQSWVSNRQRCWLLHPYESQINTGSRPSTRCMPQLVFSVVALCNRHTLQEVIMSVMCIRKGKRDIVTALLINLMMGK